MKEETATEVGARQDAAAVEQEAKALRMQEYLREEHRRCGNVSVEEALEIGGRYNASHFRERMPAGTEQARYSIPANPRRDDDMRLTAFIARADRAFKLVSRMRLFIHNDVGVVLSDTEEFEAIDEEIAELALEADLPKEPG